jgi:cytochrome c-type biogenesis protein CcmH
MIRKQIAKLTIIRISAIVLLSIAAMPSWAVMPDEVLKDPALESRARVLSQELRCVVCQNQSIDDSNAPLAHDLRVLLRDRLASGDSDQQALDFIVARYGNFVLLKPPMQLNTLLLWIGPLLILLVAGIGFGRYVGRAGDGSRPTEAPSPLSDNERERIETLLNERSSA